MAQSFYKGPQLGGRPPCAICMGPGEGERRRLLLPGGVGVWLCAAHASPGFQRRRAGRDFHRSLWAVWEAADCLTARRAKALDDHLARTRRLARPSPRPRPGSYSWPELRREAERRWAAGEGPRPVIDELRGRAASAPARPPSRPTMYRWWREGRWRPDGAGS
jgi:hypothetical protein